MQQLALRLLRQSFEEFVRKGRLPPLPSVLPQELLKLEFGVYVAAFENPGKKPRGWVGAYLPTKATLAEEIQSQAVNLVNTYPFRKEDLPFLSFEILLTKAPQLLADISDLLSDNGLLVRTGTRRHGVSLPRPRKCSPGERLAEACRHAGIDKNVEDIRLYEFGVDVLSE